MSGIGPDVKLHETVYVHPSVHLYGSVVAGEGSSFWPNAVARAECHHVAIGRFTNIQDFVMLHAGWGHPVIVGDYCSIAHHVTLHGCTIGDNCLIGINATVMDGCVIGDNCIVAGAAFLKEGTIIPDNSIVMGSPASVKTTRNCFVTNRANALGYHFNAQAYARGDHRGWSSEAFKADVKVRMAEIEEEFARRYGDA
ncbi:MAG: gamma carbonic anhydrase family protein [Rhodospirillales bacterium]|nr:gamma carbonic anhydrase family protein [Rhodospirillales bacterium]